MNTSLNGLNGASNGHLKVQVAGRHVDVGDALRSRIVDEMAAGLGKYFEQGGTADVVLSKDRYVFRIDIVATLASGQQLVCSGAGGDAHAAFSDALERLESRIRRYKRRLKNHHANVSSKAESASYIVLRSPEDDDDLDSIFDGAPTHHDGAPQAMVIAESQADVKSLTVSMAVLELDLSGAPVLLFRNAAHGGLSVVYRRADGNIGWIDPERTIAPSASSKTHAESSLAKS